MALSFAGQFGPDVVLSPAGRPQPGAVVTVKNLDGTTATLYTDRTKATPAPNPFAADSLGMFTFWATPGRYLLVFTVGGVVVGQFSIVVGLDPSEEDVDVDALTSSIAAEVVSRTSADTAEASARAAAVSAETSARAAADAAEVAARLADAASIDGGSP